MATRLEDADGVVKGQEADQDGFLDINWPGHHVFVVTPHLRFGKF